jgi:23S rRNA (uracil1939-C5)-methyltransferase
MQPEMAVLELRAERLVAGGDALARDGDGRVVFVTGALPGEVVHACVVAEWRDYARAIVDTVVEPSPVRTDPPCPFHAAGCGGCAWQHIEIDAQRELKRGVVVEALARTGGLRDVDVTLGPALTPWGFRTTVRLAVDSGRLGFRAAQSHDVVPVDRCLVAHPLLTDVIAESSAPDAEEVTARVGVASGERLVVIDPPTAEATTVVPDGVAKGRGATVTEVVGGEPLRISARSFFQTRVDGAEALVAAVRDAVGDARPSTIVDAYAGVGLFAAVLGHDAEVVCIEQSGSSCGDARHNLAGRNATIVQGRVERWRPSRADLVVADPSRRGLGAKAVDVLAATGAPRLVLVSCDAVALARDARLLTAAGYRLGRATLVDLFPQTPHVETVSVFDRG